MVLDHFVCIISVSVWRAAQTRSIFTWGYVHSRRINVPSRLVVGKVHDSAVALRFFLDMSLVLLAPCRNVVLLFLWRRHASGVAVVSCCLCRVPLEARQLGFLHAQSFCDGRGARVRGGCSKRCRSVVVGSTVDQPTVQGRVVPASGAFPISRSRAHTHRRHGHPLQTVPSAGLIERPQEKNRVDALR